MTTPSDPNAELADALENASEADRTAYRVAARVLKSASPLQRATCPPTADLIASPEELGERASRRDAHVAACPACRDDLADFRVLDAEPAPSLAATAAAIYGRIVLGLSQGVDAISRQLDLIESTLDLSPVPALGVARGAAKATGLESRIPLGEGHLRFEWGAGRGGIDLRATTEGDAPTTYRLVLGRPGGGTLESRTSGENGVAQISGIAPGSYALRVYAPHPQAPAIELELELRDS